MYYDMNGIVKKELNDIQHIITCIESNDRENIELSGVDTAVKENDKKWTLYVKCTSEGIVYHKQLKSNGKHFSKKLGGADNAEVIRIKQGVFDRTMLGRLKKDRDLLEKLDGLFLPYDQDSVDKELNEVYRDVTGLVNKAPGIVDKEEWDRIVKKNGYQMPKDPNIAPDGLDTRSKSEIIVYGILKGYGLVVKYDYEIRLIDETGHQISVSPDFIILCNDGSLIIIEHLGIMDDLSYLDKKIKMIHLFQINGYKLNDNLFLTSDYAKGKIDARVIDELVRKMILPRVKGIAA